MAEGRIVGDRPRFFNPDWMQDERERE